MVTIKDINPPGVIIKFKNNIQLPEEKNILVDTLKKNRTWDRILDLILNEGWVFDIQPYFKIPISKIPPRIIKAAQDRNGINLGSYYIFYCNNNKRLLELLGKSFSDLEIEYAYEETISLILPSPNSENSECNNGNSDNCDENIGRNNDFIYPNGCPYEMNSNYLYHKILEKPQIYNKTAIIERGWNFDHEDLKLSEVLVYGQAMNDIAYVSHGTSTLGIINSIHNSNATNNSTKISGLIKNISHISCISTCYQVSSEDRSKLIDFNNYNFLGYYIRVSNAILGALVYAELDQGDVLLIEEQYKCKDPSTDDCTPVECDQVTFDMISIASELGVTIIEPAGNGGKNLDKINCHPELIGENNNNLSSNEDSGAIIVAAGKRRSPSDGWERLNESCYGNRVNCFSWGQHVSTLTSKLDGCSFTSSITNNDYTSCFGGTSSASAIIAGAASLVQCFLQSIGEPPLSTSDIRKLLSNPEFGTGSLSNQNIGVMPDLKKIYCYLMSLYNINDTDCESVDAPPLEPIPQDILSNIQIDGCNITQNSSSIEILDSNYNIIEKIEKNINGTTVYLKVRFTSTEDINDVFATTYLYNEGNIHIIETSERHNVDDSTESIIFSVTIDQDLSQILLAETYLLIVKLKTDQQSNFFLDDLGSQIGHSTNNDIFNFIKKNIERSNAVGCRYVEIIEPELV